MLLALRCSGQPSSGTVCLSEDSQDAGQSARLQMGPFKVIWSLSGQDQASPHLLTPSKHMAFLPLSVQGIVSIHPTKQGRGEPAKHVLCLTRVFTHEGCNRDEFY